VVSFVHAETSTGVCQPVEAIARAARDAGALVVLDCVTSLGGLPVAARRVGHRRRLLRHPEVSVLPARTLAASFSARAIERVRTRETPVQSWYLDVGLLASYFGGPRAYHHTAPITAILGLAEGLKIVEEEGMEVRAARHRTAAEQLIEGVRPLGFEPLVEARYRLPMLTTCACPTPCCAAARPRCAARCSSATASKSAAGSASSRPGVAGRADGRERAADQRRGVAIRAEERAGPRSRQTTGCTGRADDLVAEARDYPEFRVVCEADRGTASAR
jgi:aspartate aminotransferase-like enzyme